MANKNTIEISDDEADPVTATTIYADKVMGFGLGPHVSKLILGMEVSSQKTIASATVILPTKELIEALQYMLETIKDDEELQQRLINGANKQIEVVRALNTKS